MQQQKPWEMNWGAQGVQVKPADPMRPGQLTLQDQNIAGNALENRIKSDQAPYVAPKAAADARSAAASASVKTATAPDEIRETKAKARKAEVDARSAELTGGAGAEQGKSASFYTRALESNNVYDKLGVGAPSALRTIAQDILPDFAVNQFTDPARQQAEAAQRNFIASTLRYESGANLPPSEFETQRKIFFPVPGDSPETIALKARFRQNAIEGLKVSAGPAALNVPNAFETATQEGRYYAPPSLEAAKGDTVTEIDGQMASAVDRMIRMGRPTREILAYAKSKGGNVLDPAKIDEAKAYLASNPKYAGGFVSATKSRPTTLGEQLAASPLSAYFNGAGTALTAGFNDELAGAASSALGGNYADTRDAFNAKKALVADANPKSDFAGNLTGSVLAMGSLGAAAPRMGALGQLMARGGGMGADVAYGSLYGAGQNNEDRLGGAVLGGAAAGLGNTLGQGVAATAAGAIAPTGGAMRLAYDMGARPSIGQRIGGIANRAEEKLQSLPLVGDMVRGTRDRARDQMERGIFNDALGQVGDTLPDNVDLGPDAHAYKQAAEQRVYSQARAGMNFVPDGQFGVELGQLQRQVGTLTDASQNRFNRIWEDSFVRRMRNGGGGLTGDAYKDASSEIGQRIRAIRSSNNGDGELADALEGLQGAVDGAARRNSPAEANALMDQADAMYARGVLIDRASNYAGGEAGRMTPSQYLRAVKQESGGVRGRQFNAGNALNQDIAEQFARMGDQVPNSGTMDRLAVAAPLAGMGWVEPNTLGALFGYGVLNAPGVRNVTTGLMAPRGGPVARTIADLIRQQQQALGTAGAGTAIALPSSR